MSKSVTLRLKEDVYKAFVEAAMAENRSLSNLIVTAALNKIREQQFVDDAEMAEILTDQKLMKRIENSKDLTDSKKLMGVTMIIGTISSKGQVTVPKKIREFLQVGTYDKIVFIPLEDGNVLITGKRNPARALFGMLKHRSFKQPVSIEQMNNAIIQRRVKRGEN